MLIFLKSIFVWISLEIFSWEKKELIILSTTQTEEIKEEKFQQPQEPKKSGQRNDQ